MFTNVSRPSAVDVLRPFVTGDMFYADTTTTLAKLPIGSESQVLNVATGIPTWTSTIILTGLTVKDNTFNIVGNVDDTKRLKFEVDAQSTLTRLTIDTGAQTTDRTLTVPVLTANATLATISQAQSFTGVQTFADTTDSTSKDTGSIVTEGGLGVEKSVFVGGNIVATGNVAANSGEIQCKSTTGTAAVLINAAAGNSAIFQFLVNDVVYTQFYGNAANAFVVQDTANAWTPLSYLSADSANGYWTFAGTLNSTSKDTGSVVFEGGIGIEKSLYAGNAILSVGATNGVGYATGAGGTVTQITSRTTGVTLDKVCGQITLFSAAGSTSWQSFTVTNSAVATTDVVSVCQDAGTDKYMIHVTAVGAGSFEITYATTGGTTTEQPVFNFTVHKAVAA